VGQVGQQRYVDQSLKRVLKKQVEEDTCNHDTDDIAEAKFEHLIELNEKPVWQLTVDELDRQRGDQS